MVNEIGFCLCCIGHHLNLCYMQQKQEEQQDKYLCSFDLLTCLRWVTQVELGTDANEISLDKPRPVNWRIFQASWFGSQCRCNCLRSVALSHPYQEHHRARLLHVGQVHDGHWRRLRRWETRSRGEKTLSKWLWCVYQWFQMLYWSGRGGGVEGWRGGGVEGCVLMRLLFAQLTAQW